MRRLWSEISPANLDRTEPLIAALRAIGDAHQATVSQIALAWLLTYYGDTVLAIPGASKPHHAQEAAAAIAISLAPAEIDYLTDVSASVTH